MEKIIRKEALESIKEKTRICSKRTDFIKEEMRNLKYDSCEERLSRT